MWRAGQGIVGLAWPRRVTAGDGQAPREVAEEISGGWTSVKAVWTGAGSWRVRREARRSEKLTRAAFQRVGQPKHVARAVPRPPRSHVHGTSIDINRCRYIVCGRYYFAVVHPIGLVGLAIAPQNGCTPDRLSLARCSASSGRLSRQQPQLFLSEPSARHPITRTRANKSLPAGGARGAAVASANTATSAKHIIPSGEPSPAIVHKRRQR